MKHISGLNNTQICSVNDVGFIDYKSIAKGGNKNGSLAQFPPNNFNDSSLLSLNSDSFIQKNMKTSKRTEKAVPYNGSYGTYGMIDNTEKWRSELNSLASSVGLLTQNDIEEYKRKKDREEMIKKLKEQSITSRGDLTSASSAANAHLHRLKPLSASQQNPPQSQRLNEKVPRSRRTSRFSRQSTRNKRTSGSSQGGPPGSSAAQVEGKFVVDQADREAWMLQVLCQVLQTDNLVDVQAWLVSANDSEKEKIKQLIDRAMSGLESSGRIEQNGGPGQQQAHESVADTVMANLQNNLDKINLEPVGQATSVAYRERAKLPDILSLEGGDKEAEGKNNNVDSIQLDPIAEINSTKQEIADLVKQDENKTGDWASNADL
jgi:hypothetical protein